MTPTIELICGHRSIRHFTDEPISEAQREAIINSARATSSSSFLQCSSIIRSAVALFALPTKRYVKNW